MSSSLLTEDDDDGKDDEDEEDLTSNEEGNEAVDKDCSETQNTQQQGDKFEHRGDPKAHRLPLLPSTSTPQTQTSTKQPTRAEKKEQQQTSLVMESAEKTLGRMNWRMRLLRTRTYCLGKRGGGIRTSISPRSMSRTSTSFCMRGRGTDTKTDRQTDRQASKQTNKTKKQTNRDRSIDRKIDREEIDR